MGAEKDDATTTKELYDLKEAAVIVIFFLLFFIQILFTSADKFQV